MAGADSTAGAAPSGAAPAGAPTDVPTAATPLRAAVAAVRRSKVATAAVFVLLFVILSSFAAPLWADNVAKTGPFTNHLTDTIQQGGETVNVVSLDGIPIGPTFQGRYFLGADNSGRDLMVRLLYGGRNSLFIAFVAMSVCLLVGGALGILAGYFRGWVDAVISRGLDVLWATPVLLLGIALGVATALGGLNLGFVKISGDSLWLPALIIGVVNIVYVARPIRGAVLSLRERPFVEAARSQGFGSARIMRREILPNLLTSFLVLGPIVIAQTVAYEAALSFLGAGVQRPNPSWGTLIADGTKVLVSAPHLALVTGAVLAVTVLALNLIGDTVREALDPRGVVTGPEAPGR
ncbi:MAG: ABC transporter permease [Solirubrobacteraceae bacterium]|nr:ABC transporter permease [Solirubrobacteraceae bacterium]